MTNHDDSSSDAQRRETEHHDSDGKPAGQTGVTSPTSERDTQAKQDGAVTDSATAADAEVDETQIGVLPGTGGPDDVGEIEVDSRELNLSGDSIPGHPKPSSGD